MIQSQVNDRHFAGEPASFEAAKGRLAPRRVRSHRWIWGLLIVVLGVGGLVWFRPPAFLSRALHKNTQPAEARSPKGVAVVVGRARRGDLPIYLDGLGSVTALNTVTVRARVDGQLIRVAFVEGQNVHQGDVLAEIDPRPFQADLDSKIAAENQAEAQVELARITWEHTKELMPEESASPIEFQQAEATLKQMKAALAAAKANVASSRLNLEWCKVTAPIAGRIGLRLVDQGNLVHANDPNGLAVITQLQPISVVFSIPENDLPRVFKAHTGNVPLRAEAYDSDLRNRIATGSLLAVDSQIDSSTGTAKLKAIFDNRDSLLFPNQFVNIRLLVDTQKNAILVPSGAIQRSPQSVYLYVVKPDQTVEMRPITAGPAEAGQTIIEKGVQPDETVVVEGVDKLQPGSHVVAQTPDAVAKPRLTTTRRDE